MADSQTPLLNIGVVLFDKATLLDFAAPWDVFTRLPNANTHLVSHVLDSVKASGMPVAPTITWDDCPPLDVICVPGGPGHLRTMEDEALLVHLQHHAEPAQFVTAVCTGAGRRRLAKWVSRDHSLDVLEQVDGLRR